MTPPLLLIAIIHASFVIATRKKTGCQIDNAIFLARTKVKTSFIMRIATIHASFVIATRKKTSCQMDSAIFLASHICGFGGCHSGHIRGFGGGGCSRCG